MRRFYETHIEKHFQENKQMLFLVGPRQVGKTTLAKHYQNKYSESLYLNWDVVEDRTKILSGQNFIEENLPLEILREKKPLVIFDEIHKFKNWKNYLKGFYDLYSEYYHILVTGSARLDIFQSGGDSLMGRYFQLRIHPLSVRELIQEDLQEKQIQGPSKIDNILFEKLYQFGGFPAPFLKGKKNFFNKMAFS